METQTSQGEHKVDAAPDDVALDVLHLEMHTTRTVRYSVLHTALPVFDLAEPALRDTVGARKALIVIDRNVDALYGDAVRAYTDGCLDTAGYLVIHGDESEKTWAQVQRICDAALANRVGRSDVIVGIGGGVTLDISGFAASIFRRGIGYIRVPTTLIGQVDVGVGVKQGVNSGYSKNILGSFYPPLASINDSCFLRTLPRPQLAAGFAEIIKMAMVADCVLFDLVERHGAALLASGFQSPAPLARAIMVRAEAAMMRELQGNLFETNLKRLVDFGHSFSVAIEIDSKFRIPHGIAVGLDMLISTGIAVDRGLCPGSVLERMLAVYKTVGLPLSQEVCTAEGLHLSLSSVQAHRGGDLNLVVPLGVGHPTFIQDVAVEELGRSLTLLRAAAAGHDQLSI